MLLQNQVALITGSGRGIGRAIAQLFAAEGAAVFLTARTEAELAATAAEITGLGGSAHYSLADLALEADCRRIVTEARAKFGKIDILVNNAGHYGPVAPVEDYPLAEFDNVIAVHLRAAIRVSFSISRVSPRKPRFPGARRTPPQKRACLGLRASLPQKPRAKASA
jgi:NAD(P)-dependent dehydrogenase (short-subunit alcohol dehydrogenase family)